MFLILSLFSLFLYTLHILLYLFSNYFIYINISSQLKIIFESWMQTYYLVIWDYRTLIAQSEAILASEDVVSIL